MSFESFCRGWMRCGRSVGCLATARLSDLAPPCLRGREEKPAHCARLSQIDGWRCLPAACYWTGTESSEQPAMEPRAWVEGSRSSSLGLASPMFDNNLNPRRIRTDQARVQALRIFVIRSFGSGRVQKVPTWMGYLCNIMHISALLESTQSIG